TQSSLPGACVLETNRPDTAGYDQAPTCPASGESILKTPPPRACRWKLCSVSSCDAGVHPASSAEDGSQKPHCNPSLTPPTMPGGTLRRSVRRASGLVQTPISKAIPPNVSLSTVLRFPINPEVLLRFPPFGISWPPFSRQFRRSLHCLWVDGGPRLPLGLEFQPSGFSACTGQEAEPGKPSRPATKFLRRLHFM